MYLIKKVKKNYSKITILIFAATKYMAKIQNFAINYYLQKKKYLSS